MKKFGKTYCKLAGRVRKRLRHGQCDQRETTLSERCNGGRIKICRVTGDRKLCARMAAMGLYPGIEAELLCPENGGNCLLKLRGGTVCLDRAITEHVMVTGS